ncbi:hypothetical protein CYPRO_3043 [Cyclonatronum proteinivorum]|uniref:Uncharacterized protein n=1 Tax=Cyclonatronum proteinivorum TaxID=1457365 RepID=A0A345UP78_9BACT|nr:hypothetical protein [Cyclonatronum proteinivorum]AXJ02280.1 hypothetical protein CYPRO_3043 [Cyclonatronum proteinivorum]
MTTALKLNYAFPGLQPVNLHDIDARALECVKLLGWHDLPDRLIEAIEADLIGFHNELTGQFSTRDTAVLQRRASVRYWVRCYLGGLCTYDTALKMLEVPE